MSLFDLSKNKKRLALVASIAVLPLILAACQVKPLYGTSSVANTAKISISNADDRLEQVTRNQLVFLNGGEGEAEYYLELNVTSSAAGVLDSGTDNNFSAGRMTATGTYKLTRVSDGELIKSAKRSTTALYDLPNQEFSKIRALQDAQNRAGRELAEVIYAHIAAEIAK